MMNAQPYDSGNRTNNYDSPEEIMANASTTGTEHNSRRCCWWVVILGLLAVGGVVGVVVGVIGIGRGGLDPELVRIMGEVEAAIQKQGIRSTFQDGNSHQAKAINWLIRNDGIKEMDRTHVLQRFALGCFYYATHQVSTLYTPAPQGWIAATGWLSKSSNECTWMGITCNTNQKVTGISLPNNRLTGRIPPELSLIRDHLATLDLTSNLIYMTAAQWSAFEQLHALQDFLLDDNYLATDEGIPTFLGACTDLQKIRLSYNLMGGPLDNGVLDNLQKLTHLEIESNFLTGTIPQAVGDMDQLIYMYMRRNSLTFNLDWIKFGNMTNLFALWLDANIITGTIPTEFGTLSEMASLSLTNGTLGGTIPTELGNLAGLRRLWLYGNSLMGTVPTELQLLDQLEVLEVQRNLLTGDMPLRVCSVIGASTYIHKSLTADCGELNCTACCTHCPV